MNTSIISVTIMYDSRYGGYFKYTTSKIKSHQDGTTFTILESELISLKECRRILRERSKFKK